VQIRVGYELTYSPPQPTPMLLTVHNSLFPRGRSRGALSPSYLAFCADHGYRDLFGNWISRIVAPPGQIRLSGHATVNDAGNPDPTCPNAIQHAVQDLPEESLVFLLGSRYCPTDHLSEIAWNLFGRSPLGWATCASDLRFRSQPPQIRIRTRAPNQNRLGGVSRAHRSVPRLCTSGYHVVPLHERSSTLLHRLSG
jgi:hypothetical protein